MNRSLASPTSSLVLGAILLTTAGAGGADRFWTAGNGLFRVSLNWDDGSLGSPSPLDTAIFDLSGLYTVTFDLAHVTDRVLVHRGAVTFQFDPATQYELLNGSSLTPGFVVGVDAGDAASLTLAGGAALATFAELGQLPGTVGALDLDGSGCALHVEQLLRIGSGGVGMLSASGGAAITCLDAEIGRAAGAYGDATITGADSLFDVAGNLAVGKSGAGSLLVSDAAIVRCDQATVAQNLDAFGDVTITGAGSAWMINDTLDVGLRGIGSMQIDDGGQVANNVFAVVGGFPAGPFEELGGDGTVVVTGDGSSWTIDGGFFDGDLYLGLASTGRLVIEDGARVDVNGDVVANQFVTINDPLTFRLTASDDFPMPGLVIGRDLLSNLLTLDTPVQLAGGFVPDVGDHFALATARSGLDTLNLVGDALPKGLAWAESRTDAHVDLFVVPESCIFDGTVGIDCDANGIIDDCDVTYGVTSDCNDNGIPDSCDIGPSVPDCNGNGLPDACDIASGLATDCNGDGVLDECATTGVDRMLEVTGLDAGAQLGASVAARGDLAIAGAPAMRAAWIFRDGPSGLLEEQRIEPLTGDTVAFFGEDVDVDGDVAVIGARGKGGVSGGAFVFRYDGSTWQQEAILQPTGVIVDQFAEAVAISGSTIIVGSRFYPEASAPIGAVFLYEYDGSDWVEQVMFEVGVDAILLHAPDVDIDGDVAVAGQQGFGDVGEVIVYRRTLNAWNEEGSFRPPSSAFDTFGLDRDLKLALDGDTLAFTGLNADRRGAYVLRYDGAAWQDDAFVAPLAAHPSFGSAIDLDGATLVVGADMDLDGGSAYRFEHDGATWSPRGRLGVIGAASGNALGAGVAVNGGRVLAGAPFADGDGTVNLFEPDCNGNGIPDACDLSSGTSDDFNMNGIPDECEPDCNANGTPDFIDIALGFSVDVNGDAIPDECQCPADLNDSGFVGFGDLLIIIGAWGPCAGCAADIDADGMVGFTDLLVAIAAWGEC